MGDRVSIQFANGESKSVCLFSHWGGMEFAEVAKDYAQNLVDSLKGDNMQNPIDRLEPETVMVDFIRHITYDMARVSHGLYLGATPNDGDNSDNGNVIIRFMGNGKIRVDG